MGTELHFLGRMVWERLESGCWRTGDYLLDDLGQRYQLRHVSGRVIGWFAKAPETTVQVVYDAIQDDQRFIEGDQ